MSGPRSFYLISPGPRPPFHQVAEHVWGEGCDVDSDGDGDRPGSTDWTELTLELRTGAGEGPRVDVDPLDRPSLVLWIRSDDAGLAQRTAAYLRDKAGGALSSEPPP